ncbi:hypothetical protein KIPB_001733 [Kipferlia bialata]|uniref:Uncharacterized protein n=1 Tax=Kipferlia bialata TaxID=797122 RepID=A0A9K3GEC6_9EUKA|nr:hypothetical protein KIPB_001733 [Kipferlia bialata]|eukprot:g1733.t1
MLVRPGAMPDNNRRSQYEQLRLTWADYALDYYPGTIRLAKQYATLSTGDIPIVRGKWGLGVELDSGKRMSIESAVAVGMPPLGDDPLAHRVALSLPKHIQTLGHTLVTSRYMVTTEALGPYGGESAALPSPWLGQDLVGHSLIQATHTSTITKDVYEVPIWSSSTMERVPAEDYWGEETFCVPFHVGIRNMLRHMMYPEPYIKAATDQVPDAYTHAYLPRLACDSEGGGLEGWSLGPSGVTITDPFYSDVASVGLMSIGRNMFRGEGEEVGDDVVPVAFRGGEEGEIGGGSLTYGLVVLHTDSQVASQSQTGDERVKDLCTRHTTLVSEAHPNVQSLVMCFVRGGVKQGLIKGVQVGTCSGVGVPKYMDAVMEHHKLEF